MKTRGYDDVALKYQILKYKNQTTSNGDISRHNQLFIHSEHKLQFCKTLWKTLTCRSLTHELEQDAVGRKGAWKNPLSSGDRLNYLNAYRYRRYSRYRNYSKL